MENVEQRINKGTTRPRRKAQSHRKWHKWRLTVQIITFLLFIFLLLWTIPEGDIWLPRNLFFLLDPLLGIAAMLASREWNALTTLGIITLILTVLLGRVWCGWICPLGSLLDWIPARKTPRQKLQIHPYWRYVKFNILFAILAGAVLGSLSLIWLDPITLLFRSFSGVIMPGLSAGLTSIELWLYQIPTLAPVADWFSGWARDIVLTRQPFFPANLVFLAILVAVLLGNAVRSRFWCRYLCPLGALLGLISKIPFIRHIVDSEKCVSCHRCAVDCPTGAIDPAQDFAADPAECIVCMDCTDLCRSQAIAFPLDVTPSALREYDPKRREFLFSMGLGLAAGFVVAKDLPRLAGSAQSQSQVTRPPGATEESLGTRCVRCSECIKVCPEGILRLTFLETGVDGFWTPMRVGECAYGCQACGEVCPTGAIPKLSDK